MEYPLNPFGIMRFNDRIIAPQAYTVKVAIKEFFEIGKPQFNSSLKSIERFTTIFRREQFLFRKIGQGQKSSSLRSGRNREAAAPFFKIFQLLLFYLHISQRNIRFSERYGKQIITSHFIIINLAIINIIEV